MALCISEIENESHFGLYCKEMSKILNNEL